MKEKRWFVPTLALMLMVLVTLACGASSQVTPTTEAATTEVSAATQVSKAAPDLSTARISLDELPKGFKEISTDEILKAQKASGNDEFVPDLLFAFVNPKDFHLIMGMDFLLVNGVDKLGFNIAFRDYKNILKEIISGMGGQNIREQKTLEGLETLGEKQATMTMLADLEGVPMRVNAVIFQRDVVGSLLLSMTVEGQPDNISIQELGKLFDQHIQESLKIME